MMPQLVVLLLVVGSAGTTGVTPVPVPQASRLCHTGSPALVEDVFKDFGSVPRGTLATHQFRLTNPTRSTLVVKGVRTSSSWVTATVSRSELAPGEATDVFVTVDTRKFSGERSFAVSIQIEKPFKDEVQLVLHVHSREDITVEPGQLALGRVRKGSCPSGSVTIEYRGDQNWRVTGVENGNGYIQAQLQEIRRRPGRATYQLNVKLREDAPVGVWSADLWLTTNDSVTPRIRVPLSVQIEGALTASPGEILLGRLKSDTRVERKVVIRGSQPFKITKVEGADDRCQIVADFKQSKSVHVLSVVFNAGQKASDFVKRFRVFTDLPEEGAVEFAVQGEVVQ